MPISIPFLLHIVVELPACISFFLRPSATLQTAQPHAHGLIRQYALLLLSSILIAAIFVYEPPQPHHIAQETRSNIAGVVAPALAIYHLGPPIRAFRRIKCGEESRGTWLRLRNPRLHIAAHVLCIAALTWQGARVYL